MCNEAVAAAAKEAAKSVTTEAVRGQMKTAMKGVVEAMAQRGVRLTQQAAEEMAEEFTEGAVQHIAAEMQKGVSPADAAASYLASLPENLLVAAGSSAVHGGGGGSGATPPGGADTRQPIPGSTTPGQGQTGLPGANPPPQSPGGAPGGAGAPRVQFSRGGGQIGTSKTLTPGQAMQKLAEDQGRFRRGEASQSKDFMDIAKEYAIGDEVERLYEAKPFGNESTEHVYTIHLKGGGHAYILHGTNGRVWVDTQNVRSESGPAQGGDLIYQAAMTYALNNGLEFVPDHRGVSSIARFRRTSQMLSNALRHGTTRHLGKMSIEGWRVEQSPADFEHNLNLLALTEMDGVERAMKWNGETRFEDLKWDPQTDTITHVPTGRRLPERDIEQIISRLDPGNSGVGPTTLSRALVTRQALQGQVIDGGDLHREGPALPDGGGEISGDTGSDLFRIGTGKGPLFYSQPGAGDGDGSTLGSHFGGDAAKLSQQVAETTEHLNQKHPGLINDNTQVFHSAEEFLNSDYAKQHPFTEEEKAGMRGAEGFFDASTGKTIIIAGNVGLRAGETPQSALTRVVLHERVGHDGLNLLLGGSDGKANANRARWSEIQSLIPGDQLKAIGHEKGYEHLKDNPESQALEWFARQAESNPALLKDDPRMRQVWDKFTQIVQDFMARFGMDPLKGADLDTQVIALLKRARQAAVRGGSSGGPAAPISPGAGAGSSAAPVPGSFPVGAKPETNASSSTPLAAPAGQAAVVRPEPPSWEQTSAAQKTVAQLKAQRQNLTPEQATRLDGAERTVAAAIQANLMRKRDVLARRGEKLPPQEADALTQAQARLT